MIQEDRQLLLKDLCARLPYGIIVNVNGNDERVDEINPFEGTITCGFQCFDIEECKPYLCSMSSMTNREKEELLNLLFDKDAKYFYIDEEGFIDGKTSDLLKEGLNYPAFCPVNIELYTDWLNAHHFDYRGLIEKGLAIEVTDGMYK